MICIEEFMIDPMSLVQNIYCFITDESDNKSMGLLLSSICHPSPSINLIRMHNVVDTYWCRINNLRASYDSVGWVQNDSFARPAEIGTRSVRLSLQFERRIATCTRWRRVTGSRIQRFELNHADEKWNGIILRVFHRGSLPTFNRTRTRPGPARGSHPT